MNKVSTLATILAVEPVRAQRHVSGFGEHTTFEEVVIAHRLRFAGFALDFTDPPGFTVGQTVKLSIEDFNP